MEYSHLTVRLTLGNCLPLVAKRRSVWHQFADHSVCFNSLSPKNMMLGFNVQVILKGKLHRFYSVKVSLLLVVV